jgi:methionyl-tRNA formyltransferase
VKPLRLVFAGSPAAAVPSLEALLASQHDVVAVITREDSPQGRRGTLTPTPVAAAAGGAEVIKANRLIGSATDRVAELAPDLGVIVAYGGLVREPLLSTPRLGWINLHFSLLPRWRGAAPVQRAIMAGDETSGAAVFQLVPELDAGDVFGQITEPIGRHQTAGSLLEQLSHSGAGLLVRVVDALAEGTARALPQEGEVTLAPKLTLADGAIDWKQPGEVVANRVRGVTPEPGAFTTLDGARLKVLDAQVAREAPRVPAGHFVLDGRRLLVGTASDPIELLTVLPAGKKAMAAADWWRGRPDGARVVAE